MAVIARNDRDRMTDGVGTGNVITGTNTVSGAAGKDDGTGLVVTRVGHYLTITNVGPTGVDIAGTYGTLHIDPNGNYSYTRTAANLWDINFPAFGKEEKFVYEIRDNTGAVSIAELTIPILQQVNPSVDPVTGIHSGTEYDDYINVSSAAVKTDGGAGQDRLVGTDSANYILGGAGNDLLLGNGGNDTLEGGAGADLLDGGAGTDVASYASSKAAVTIDLLSPGSNTGDAKGDMFVSIERIEGSGYSDSLSGDNNANRFIGGLGADKLYGRGGNDYLEGGVGNDILDGGDGSNDVASYANSAAAVTINLATNVNSGGDAFGDKLIGIEVVYGSIYADSLTGDSGANILSGGAGDDKLDGGAGDDWLIGDSGSNWFKGGDGADTHTGTNNLGFNTVSYVGDPTGDVVVWMPDTSLSTGWAKGDRYFDIETIETGAGNDTLFGDANGNTFVGGGGNDLLIGDGGNDQLNGGTGDDKLYGGAGNDWFYGFNGAGADTFDGGDGDDAVFYTLSTAVIVIDRFNPSLNAGDAKGDTYTDVEAFVLSDFADKFFGTNAAETVMGEKSSDELTGRGGDDKLYGGEGNDTLNGDAGIDFLRGDYGDDTLNGGADLDTLNGSYGNDKLNGGDGFDFLSGDDGNDTLKGDAGGDNLHGGLGNDTIDGGIGDDILFGDAGDDTLTGGGGTDTFAWSVGDTGKDTVTDFSLGQDRLAFTDVLDGAGDDVQDLIDAGFTASTSGSTLTIGWNNGASQITIAGWTGGQVENIAELAQSLGADLLVS